MKETLPRRISVYGIVHGVGYRQTERLHATTINNNERLITKVP